MYRKAMEKWFFAFLGVPNIQDMRRYIESVGKY